MVPPDATGYVQVCNGFANKKIKELISKQEEMHYDQYKDK
jgi:bacterioferritin-associated ferredoxin